MNVNVAKEVATLQRMTINQLRERYVVLFGEVARTNNRAWLVRRITWRMQAQAEGDLSDRARERAAELANEADLRLSPPKVLPAPVERTRIAVFQANGDDRVPVPGTIITRVYKGKTLQVKVVPHGFEYEGEVHKSLSAVAKAITGQHMNGYHFFRLAKGGAA